jgi:hypothetical protein
MRYVCQVPTSSTSSDPVHILERDMPILQQTIPRPRHTDVTPGFGLVHVATLLCASNKNASQFCHCLPSMYHGLLPTPGRPYLNPPGS